MLKERLLVVSARLESGPGGLRDTRIETKHLRVSVVNSVWDARNALLLDPEIHVVLMDSTLTDGNWCDLLRMLNDLGVSADFYVMSESGHTALALEVESRGARLVDLSVLAEMGLARRSEPNRLELDESGPREAVRW